LIVDVLSRTWLVALLRPPPQPLRTWKIRATR